MSRNKQKKPDYNENWETEIAAYDDACKIREKEYREKYFIIPGSGSDKLTEEENEVLTLFLNGVSCEDIAKQNDVEIEIIVGLLEIIRAKLSLDN